MAPHPVAQNGQKLADQVFLEENGVTVTEAQLLVPGESFMIRDILRVGVVRKRRSKIPAILLALIGLAMWVPESEIWWLGYAGLGIVAAAWIWARKIKTDHQILLDMVDGEMTALHSQDERWVERIVKALNDAKRARSGQGGDKPLDSRD